MVAHRFAFYTYFSHWVGNCGVRCYERISLTRNVATAQDRNVPETVWYNSDDTIRQTWRAYTLSQIHMFASLEERYRSQRRQHATYRVTQRALERLSVNTGRHALPKLANVSNLRGHD